MVKIFKGQFSKTIIGLIISLLFPVIAVLGLLPSISSWGITENIEAIIGLAFMWLISVILIIHIIFYEKRSLRSIGIAKLNLKQTLYAIGLGFLLSLLIPIIYALMHLIFGFPVFVILGLMIIAGFLIYLAERIYKWDVNLVYGNVLKKLSQLMSDMEELRN